MEFGPLMRVAGFAFLGGLALLSLKPLPLAAGDTAMPAGEVRSAAGDAAHETAVFAGGCFWAMEAAFDEVAGVTRTVSGYAGGSKPNPTYGDHEGYREAVQVTYDPKKVSYAQLLDHYWHNIDPFDASGQFCDQAPPYRTAVFTANGDERKEAESTKALIQTRFKQTVATDILPQTTFVAAEGYHQDYHEKHPTRFEAFEWQCGQPQRLKQIWGSGKS